MFARLFAITTLAITVVASSAFAEVQHFMIDKSHSRIGFSVKHMVITNVKGSFTKYSGHFMLSPKNVLTDASASIQVASLDTGIKKRDDHLRSPDFFDVEMFPTIKFSVTKIEPSGNSYNVVGDLTIKDVTKSVTLAGELLGVVKDPWGKTRAGFTAHGEISRNDFNIKWNKALEAGGLIVGDKIRLELEIEGIKHEMAMNPCNPCGGKR